VDDDAFSELMADASWAMLHGSLDEALGAYVEAEMLARTDAQRAQLLEGKGNVAIKREEFAEAAKLLRSAIDLVGNAAPPSTWGNLGFALDKLGEFSEAVSAHRKCIEGHEKTDGVDHPRTLRTLGDLAYSLTGLGQLDEAEAVLERVVEGFESQPGREPLWHAKALNAVGYFQLRSRRDPGAALAFFEQAECLRDACTLRSKTGKVVTEGFPASFDAVLAGNRAAAVAELGRAEEAAQLRARADMLGERAREASRRLRDG
jgi:tetratricopeptide (TPR) repeat protein